MIKCTGAEVEWDEINPSFCVLICRVNGITDETPANVSNAFVLHKSVSNIYEHSGNNCNAKKQRPLETIKAHKILAEKCMPIICFVAS